MTSQHDLSILRHSAAHLLAHAVQELYPATKLTIGPATEEGFFYDFFPSQNFKDEDLTKLEAKMHEIAARNLSITHQEINKETARKLFKDNPFKLELIEGIPGNTVGLSVQGDFQDLCRGGHVASTGDIKYFKLLAISGSYWRADRSKQALQRISGTAFFSNKELEDFLRKKEEAERYDHRRLGKQMDLFSFHEEGPGFVFYHPKGKAIFNALVDYMRKIQREYNYQEIATPIILSDELWKRSGHYAHYKDNMYFCTIDERNFAIKPMNCPGSILIYKNRPRSYRELPLKLSEFGLVHRHELSGVLSGLLRVRAFTQDDAHIYCMPDQIESEVITILTIIKKLMKQFGFDEIKIALSTKPAKAMGSDELWEKAINALKHALDKAGMVYTIQEGEGAFYGPKVEIKIKDSLGREWQCGTIQIDFFQPENFDLSYVASGGTKERPVIIHQALYGSLERFIAILLEHHKGDLPFFIAPVQVKVLPITNAQREYAQRVLEFLKKHGIRTQLDDSSDPISGKIKTAQLERIPWMIIVGKREEEREQVTLRYLDGKQEANISINDVIAKAQQQSS